MGSLRIETAGPAPIHRLARLLCRYGHGDAAFEVWDGHPPFGGPGRVILAGKVRHLARLALRKPVISNDVPFGADFWSDEQAVPNPSQIPRRNEPPPVVHLWIKRAIEALEALEIG